MDTSSSGLNYVLYTIYGVYVYICMCVCIYRYICTYITYICVHIYLYILKVKVAQLCPTVCGPMGDTVHGILQARILEWVAVPFSKGSSQPRD